MELSNQISKLTNTEFEIGSLVAFNSHPYFISSHKDEIYLSGEVALLTPLMIITELLKEKKEIYEEHSGKEITNKNTFQCKCIWFSVKNNQFQEAWISSKLLKEIKGANKSPDLSNINIGDSVLLKTNYIEIGKKKSTFKQLGNDENISSITNLLSFCSPALEVIGTSKYESKEQLMDPRTGLQKRWVSERLIKCKFFCPNNDKISEISLPIEALHKIHRITNVLLDNIEKFIKNNSLFKITDNSSLYFKETIIKPIRINYKAGHYFLSVKNLLTTKTEEILLTSSENIFTKSSTILESMPKFSATGSTLKLAHFTNDNLLKINQKKYWKIKYQDFSGTITERTIYSPSYFTTSETQSNGKVKKIDYLKANCILRNNEERYFRTDRILKLDVLDIDYDINDKTKIKKIVARKKSNQYNQAK